MPSIGVGININAVSKVAAAAPAAISFVAAGTEYDGTVNATNWVIDNVNTTIAGDLLVLVMGHSVQTINSGPSGWNEVTGSGQQPPSGGGALRCYWRYATGSDPANYTWVFAVAAGGGAVILQFRDPHGTNPIDALLFNSGGFTTSAIGSSISPTGSTDQLIFAAIAAGTRTFTGPGGAMTERLGGAASAPGTFAGTATLSASGATGTRTATVSSAANWATMMLALKGA